MFSSSKQDLKQSNRGPVLKKRLKAQLCHMPMNVFCMSFRLIFTGLLFISIIKSLVMYISASWFSYSLVTSVRLFNFGHLSLSYQPHILTEIPISRASMIICYALNSFILDVTLFWIRICEYHLQSYRLLKRFEFSMHTGMYFFSHKLPGKECIVSQWHFWYRLFYYEPQDGMVIEGHTFLWIIVTIIESQTTSELTPMFLIQNCWFGNMSCT